MPHAKVLKSFVEAHMHKSWNCHLEGLDRWNSKRVLRKCKALQESIHKQLL